MTITVQYSTVQYSTVQFSTEPFIYIKFTPFNLVVNFITYLFCAPSTFAQVWYLFSDSLYALLLLDPFVEFCAN